MTNIPIDLPRDNDTLDSTAAEPETPALNAMTTDHFQRIRELVMGATDSLTEAVGTWRPDPEANSISWLIWHLTRVQDSHVAHLADVDQVWAAHGWHDRCALPFDPTDIGFGHTAEQVGEVRLPGDVLLAYHEDVHDLCLDYARGLTAERLNQIVDTNWDPPVTESARLVSLLGDCLQHAGQAAYIRGMAARAGIG